jgi:hypothetical protein
MEYVQADCDGGKPALHSYAENRNRSIWVGCGTCPLLTIERSSDNMCTLGQIEAAHAVCPNIPDAKRAHHVQGGAACHLPRHSTHP